MPNFTPIAAGNREGLEILKYQLSFPKIFNRSNSYIITGVLNVQTHITPQVTAQIFSFHYLLRHVKRRHCGSQFWDRFLISVLWILAFVEVEQHLTDWFSLGS